MSSWSLVSLFVCAATGMTIKVTAIRRINVLFIDSFLICFSLAITHSTVGITLAFSCGAQTASELRVKVT